MIFIFNSLTAEVHHYKVPELYREAVRLCHLENIMNFIL